MTKQQLIQARIALFQQELAEAQNAGNWEVASSLQIKIDTLEWCLELLEQPGEPYPFTADAQTVEHG